MEGLGLVFILIVFCFMGRFMLAKFIICQIAQKGLKNMENNEKGDLSTGDSYILVLYNYS